MHTATQLDRAMFDIRIHGARSDFLALLPGWTAEDRLGVVVTEPLGGIGASLLIQLAITAFYDARADRRGERGQYPDFYLFHVGGRFGDHSAYDFWPEGKEVFLGAQAEDVLGAIHAKGITRLAVPEGPSRTADQRWKEPQSAPDGIASAFVYSASGNVVGGDVRISGTDPRTEENTRFALEPQRLVEALRAAGGGDPAAMDPRYYGRLLERMDEVDDEDRARAASAHSLLLCGGLPSESYRRISVAEALERLAVDGARERTASASSAELRPARG